MRCACECPPSRVRFEISDAAPVHPLPPSAFAPSRPDVVRSESGSGRGSRRVALDFALAQCHPSRQIAGRTASFRRTAVESMGGAIRLRRDSRGKGHAVPAGYCCCFRGRKAGSPLQRSWTIWTKRSTTSLGWRPSDMTTTASSAGRRRPRARDASSRSRRF